MTFNFQSDKLTCSGRPLDELGKAYGTPLFVYSEDTLRRNILALKSEFADRNIHISYAMKANNNHAVLKMMRQGGLGVDIVSGGELHLALAAGFTGAEISFAGIGKTRSELVAAMQADVSQYNVESTFELEMLNEIAGELGKTAVILMRLNPDIDAQTHPKITTGLRENKFGMPAEEVFQHFLEQSIYPNLNFAGIHCHIGSQILNPAPFTDLVDYLVEFTERLGQAGISITKIDLGGGFGVDYESPFRDIMDTTPFLGKLAEYASNKLGKYELFIQPGRVLVANAAILLTQVIGVKNNGHKTFVIVDAAMTEMVRPSLYSAYHALIPVQNRGGGDVVDVVGPVCETGDYFAHSRQLTELKAGDYIALGSAGAYGYAMASNYNARPTPAEIMVTLDGGVSVIRNRQTYEDFGRLDA